MIEGIACSTSLIRDLLKLPRATYSRIETALRKAFRFPEAVQEYANVPWEHAELHIILSEDVLFLLGENGSRIELLRVMLFQPEGTTLH